MIACPYCQHKLSPAEIGALYSSLRVNRKGGRPPGPTGHRKKPRAYETMPIIMDLLKRFPNQALAKREILAHVEAKLEERGYDKKAMATGWGLNYLQQKGLVKNVRHGYWRVTPEGIKERMTEEIGMQITAEIEGAYG